ncbi:acyl-CoA dehydrogenase family protein [Alicycliphilus denitrificans]|uniref:Acyl-CoA dehydrogenase n=1 Tax=Alicycliphilus denitrificans TaxID=179636 RepID=A0A420KA71_9BURK|nr:acyl-CoA dehydrogenase family protein [Alicycliphilus denitrificans]RKJ95679.1 acyl-CoA dehydrogenase [Alicycliphilus denitrificans]HRO80695.1 acyl-CoA dehydrogenase family protein [Alicycliphilus denitrificans]
MQVGYSAEDEAFRLTLREWFETHYPRFKAGWPVPPDPNELAWRRAWEDYVCQAGWSGLGWPLEYGGKAWPLTRQAIFHEEQARIGAPLGVNIIGHGILAPTLIHFASAAQKARYLPGILANRDIWCQGYSEPGAGSDLAALATRAERRGDHYVLNGHKIWTSFAHIADYCFVLARTDPGAQRHKGISFLLVDMKSPGVRVEPIRQITGEADFNEVFFEDVRVPLDALVGEENGGWRLAMAAASFERGTYFIPRQVRFTQEVEALGRLAAGISREGSESALQDPHLRREIARLAVDSHVLRLKGLRALTHALRGGPPGAEGSSTKLHWSEAHQKMMNIAMELLGERALQGPGPAGADPAAALWARDYLWTRAETILAGTSEVQRNILAEQMLGLPR